MKQTLEPGDLPLTWDAQALYDKAERFVQQAHELAKDSWDYALWTSLSLELLARAALSNVHPALLAEADRNASNLISALGFEPVDKFSPKSIQISEVFRRLRTLLPNFQPEHESFGVLHTGRRNMELHSGDLAFDGIKGSSWQPRYYDTCSVLLESMGLSLTDFVGAAEAKAADALIAAAADKSAMAVKGEVEAHRKVWEAKGDAERAKLIAQSELWASRHTGHRVECPACGSPSLVFGEPVAAATRTLADDIIIDRQEHLPTHFECVACGLRINNLSRLAVVGIADRFTNTQEYDAAQFYAPEEDEWAAYEDDNNER
ncbi:hypothetical protein [Sphingopyxis sp. EG6]|jgi:hypothetical protein|uniref:hypothetical protein n=1 Tax=Sphingopyxis sp. EG6 TaxID=1874061 RepID=UPI000DC61966|nr:hypothetical protein [Sphingopyxis sp. EG6]BBB08716.1 hypothetical protein SPYCW_1732 [Sphingopyxis sp. EG6]